MSVQSGKKGEKVAECEGKREQTTETLEDVEMLDCFNSNSDWPFQRRFQDALQLKERRLEQIEEPERLHVDIENPKQLHTGKLIE